jgi:hypothetical protein
VAVSTTAVVRAKAPPLDAAAEPSSRVAFSDLVSARFAARESESDPASPAMQRYLGLRTRFEEHEGEIVREYWGTDARVGLAITRSFQRRLDRLLGIRPPLRLHRSTDLEPMPPELEAALADGDTVAVAATEVLLAGSASTILNRLFEAHRYLLTVVNSEVTLNPEWWSAIRGVLRESAAGAPSDVREGESQASAP